MLPCSIGPSRDLQSGWLLLWDVTGIVVQAVWPSYWWREQQWLHRGVFVSAPEIKLLVVALSFLLSQFRGCRGRRSSRCCNPCIYLGAWVGMVLVSLLSPLTRNCWQLLLVLEDEISPLHSTWAYWACQLIFHPKEASAIFQHLLITHRRRCMGTHHSVCCAGRSWIFSWPGRRSMFWQQVGAGLT